MDDNKIPQLDAGFEEVDMTLDEGFEEVPQKKNENSPLNSVGGTSGSTDVPSGYAPPSISKIKRENVKALQGTKNQVINDGLANALKSNKSVRYKNLLVDALAKKGYDKDELYAVADQVNPPDETELSMRVVNTRTEPSEEVLTPQEAEHITEKGGKIPVNVKVVEPRKEVGNAKPPFVVETVMDHVINSSVGIAEGLNSMKQGLQKMNMVPDTELFKDTGKATKDRSINEQVEGATDFVKGAGHTAFGAANLAIPAMAGFGIATTGLHKLPSKYKDDVMRAIAPTSALETLPEEKRAEAFDKAIDLPFALVTSVAEASGYERGKDGRKWLDNVMEIGDLLVPILGHKAGTGVNKRVKSIQDLKDLTERITNEKATEQDLQDFKDINTGIKDLTAEDIQLAAEQKLEKNPVIDDELHTKLAELQSKVNEESFAELPVSVREGILKEIDSTKNEILTKQNDKVSNDLSNAQSETRIADIDVQIEQAGASMEGQTQSVKESIQSTIDNLITERMKLEPLTEERLMDMPALSIRNYSKGIKNKLKNQEVEFFGEDGAKQYNEALKVLNSNGSTTDQVKSARETISRLEDTLNPKQKKSFFNSEEASPEQLSEAANRLEVVESAESINDLVDAAKKPLLNFSKDKSDLVSKLTLNAVKKKAAELGVGSEDLIKKLSEEIASELPDKSDGQFLVENLLNNLGASSEKQSTIKSEAILPEKQSFIESGIKELQDVEEYNENYHDIYVEVLAKKHDILNENRPKEDSIEREPVIKTFESEAEIADSFTAEELRFKIDQIDQVLSETEPIVNLQNSVDNVTPKKLKLGERILESEIVDREIKSGLEKKGIEYIPINLELTQSQAKEYVKSFVEAGELDKAISNVTDTSNKMTGLNRAAIGKELFEVLADNASKAETIAEKMKWQNKAADIAKFTAENFKAAGQEINAAKAWKRMLERTPEGAIASIKNSINEKNDATLKKHSKEISSAKEVIDEFIKSEEFAKIVGEKVAAEFDKIAKKNPKKENIFNSKKVREDRKAELREKWKKAGKDTLTSGGLSTEKIEILGEMALIHIIDGVVKLENIAAKLKKDFDEITPEQTKEMFEKHKVTYDEKSLTLKDLASQMESAKVEAKTITDILDVLSGKTEKEIKAKAFKEAVKELQEPKTKTQRELRDKLFSEMESKVKQLKPENRKKFVGEVIKEVYDTGGLEEGRFKELYAKELGLETLGEKGEATVRGLIDTINKAEKTADELKKLFDNKDLPDKELRKQLWAKEWQWRNDVAAGQKANAKLSEYFKGEKTIGNTLSTILQGNLLGPLSLVKNVYSNTLIQPLRFLSRGISSSADYLMSKSASLPVINKYIDQKRTVDALAYWRGQWGTGVAPGIATGVKEVFKGINPEQMLERDLSQNLNPEKMWVEVYDKIAHKKPFEKKSLYQGVNNFIEGTFGIPAEMMFRALNLGDKPYRMGAEYGAAREIGRLKGLKGRELEKFSLFPDAESAELIKKRSETAVYQQAEGASKVIQDGLKSWEKFLSEVPKVGEVLQVIHKSQIPYVKTPLNFLAETFTYTFPEYAAARGVYEAAKGNRRESLEYLGKAVVGSGIRLAANQLMQNGLMTGTNDRKDPEGSQIQFQNVPPNSLNITAMQRIFSGGSPKIQDNDVWINYSNMGVVGMLLGVHANQKPIQDVGYLEELGGSISYTAKSAVEQSFLSGANTALEALTGDEASARKWEINTLGALASIFYPNTLANVSKAKDDASRVVKADSFSDELANTFKTKMFMGHQLPSKVNLWGETIHQVPEGNNKYVWYLFNVTKAKPVDTDSYNYKIYDLWKSLPEEDKSKALPSIPRNNFMVKKKKVMLDPIMYEKYQKYTGKNRANLVEKYVKSDNWKKDAEEKKLEKLKKIYETGADSAKKKLLLENPKLTPKK